MITNALVNKILFVIEITFAELIYTVHLKKRSHYYIRIAAYFIVTLFAAVLFPSLKKETFWYSSFMFLFLFAVTIPLLKFCYDESWENLLFCGIAGYTTQHLGYTLTAILNGLTFGDTSFLLGLYSDKVNLVQFNKRTILNLLVKLLCNYVTYFACYGVFGKNFKKRENLQLKSAKLLFIVGAGLFVDVLLNSMFVYEVAEKTFIGTLIISAYGGVSCILLLVVQFDLVLVKQFEKEKNLIELLWEKDKEQYHFAKGNVDAINRKCHDIKYQIRNIGNNKSVPDDVVEEIEEAVAIYDTFLETGNDVLDVILREKSLRCHNEKITFSCMADGKLLKFMKNSDVYSLFGNALDNAIEASLKILEEEKRVINLTLKESSGTIYLNVSNSFVGDLLYENSEIKTTKENRYLHGFGIKSMQNLVKSYDGDMYISVKDGTFNLNVMFYE